MLTSNSIKRTQKQMSAFGEGKHRFGHGLSAQLAVPRDKDAVPKEKEKSNENDQSL